MKGLKPTRKTQMRAYGLIMGSGTSTGVPLISCSCKVCRSKNPKNHRTRASLLLQLPSQEAQKNKKFDHLLIDTATDLRTQALREKITFIDAVLYTHPHSDHVSGIDEIRSFNFIQKKRIPAYAHTWTFDELQMRYPYIFRPTLNEGGGIPQIDLNFFDFNQPQLNIKKHSIQALKVMHGSQECAAFRVQNFAYVTDCSLIPKSTLDQLANLEVLVLDCIRLAEHSTHFNLEQALTTIEMLKPKKAYLTHMGHDFEYNQWSKKGPRALLPKNVFLAYDGLKIPFQYSID